MSTQFHWSSKRQKAALALAEGQSQQAVAEAIGICRKTICNWLCVTEFLAEVLLDGREIAALKPRAARRRPRSGVGVPVVRPPTATLCHKARPNERQLPRGRSPYACFQQAMGSARHRHLRPGAGHPQQVEHWLVARLAPSTAGTSPPGAHGGRCIFSDRANRPARITGMYETVPLRRLGLRRRARQAAVRGLGARSSGRCLPSWSAASATPRSP